MAIARTNYITIAELNEILGVTSYTSADMIKIYEASELLEYFMRDEYNTYTTLNAPTNLKLATAYQVLYNETNDDNEYQGNTGAFSLGKFSTNESSSGGEEFKKISPKSRRYLIEGGLTRRVI